MTRCWASPSSWVNVTRTFTMTSLIFVLLLSYNQFCSGPFPLPIHLTCPYETIPASPESAAQPQIKSLDLPSFITVCLLPTGAVLSSIFSLTCWVQQSQNPLKRQTTVPVINQALVLKGGFISSKINRYPHSVQRCLHVCESPVMHACR